MTPSKLRVRSAASEARIGFQCARTTVGWRITAAMNTKDDTDRCTRRCVIPGAMFEKCGYTVCRDVFHSVPHKHRTSFGEQKYMFGILTGSHF